MSLINKQADMTPFDMQQKPCRQSRVLLPIVWAVSFFLTRKFKLKIKKIKMTGIKPPYLVLSTHQGFTDYYIAPLALFPHRANYVSDMEGFASFGKTLYRKVGCIGKRRYVPDLSVMKNIIHVLHKNKDILVLFPESRHSNVGTTSLVPDNMGKLCKRLNVPVVILSVHGSYLANPFWDETHTRKVPIVASLECICTKEQLDQRTECDLQAEIELKLAYDEYAWQKEKRIPINGEKLAEGLHKPLYKCPACSSEFFIFSQGNTLECKSCGEKWDLNEFGELVNGKTHTHIPSWYEWERKQVIQTIEKGQYSEKFNVSVEALPNEKGFVPIGDGILYHDSDGFRLSLSDREMSFSSKSLESVQTEYDYRGKGPCIVLSTQDCCYYIYSNDQNFNPTKMQFAAEYFH